MRGIVDTTWRPEGLTFDWVEGHDDIDAWKGINIWVAAVSGMPVSGAGGVLGEVVFHNGAPQRLIRVSIDAAIAWVRHDEIARLGTSTLVLDQGLGTTDALVPRALGHIVAHEIGHFVLGTMQHSSSGLMRATFERARRLLVRPETLRLDAAGRARLATRLTEAAGCP